MIMLTTLENDVNIGSKVIKSVIDKKFNITIERYVMYLPYLLL